MLIKKLWSTKTELSQSWMWQPVLLRDYQEFSIFGRNSLSRRLACPVPLPWRRWVEHYLRVQVPRCVVIVVIVSSFRFSKFFEIFYEPSEPSIPSHPSPPFHRTRECKKSFPDEFGSPLGCLFHNFIRSNGKSSNQNTRFWSPQRFQNVFLSRFEAIFH